jgi:phosphate transport system substrate-binding protein
MKMSALTAAIALVGAMASGAAYSRDQIKVVGSSTVFPYSQAVAEEFAKETGMKAPVVESLGTGGGFKAFCQGVGEAFADVTGASRAIKKSEFDDCQKNGVKDIIEALIGYDGLSIAISKKGPDMNLTEAQIFQALAKDVPVDGKLVPNPYKKWSDIDKSLPDMPILAYGPSPTSGTRDAFVELAMHDGCKALPYFKEQKAKLDAKEFEKLIKEACSPMRADGPFIEAGENDNLIVQRLVADPNAVGIFGYSFLYENQDQLKAVKVEGVEVSFDTIADQSYDIARPLYIYIKKAHLGVIPGLDKFVEEYVSTEALGKGGYLPERGLTYLQPDALKKVQDSVKAGQTIGEPKA